MNIIRNRVKKAEKNLRILILGLDNAGKTTILKALSNESIDDIKPTTGFNVKNLLHDGYNLNVWDVGGQEILRKYWEYYYETTDALVYVIDSSDTKRLELSGIELKKILAVKFDKLNFYFSLFLSLKYIFFLKFLFHKYLYYFQGIF